MTTYTRNGIRYTINHITGEVLTLEVSNQRTADSLRNR